jgi:hypothetical protein
MIRKYFRTSVRTKVRKYVRVLPEVLPYFRTFVQSTSGGIDRIPVRVHARVCTVRTCTSGSILSIVPDRGLSVAIRRLKYRSTSGSTFVRVQLYLHCTHTVRR